jgi:glycosyltransferase involved in cell wall biosynthesis
MSAAGGKIRIGTNRGVLYCQERNILLPYDHFEIRREWDFAALLNHGYACLGKGPHPKYYWLHDDLGFSRSRLFHLYNAVSRSDKPWIATAESSFSELKSPAFDPFEFLARDSCKAILHLSQWGYDLQLRHLHPGLKDAILPKMQVCHPPQKVLADESSPKDFRRRAVRFVLVGNSFYRKGGYETLTALERLRKQGYRFTMDVVGSLFYGERNHRAFGGERPAQVKRIAAQNPGCYTFHGMLRHAETLDVMRKCDVGLLPSLKDRYGFAVLEYMACGLPAVTTNQRVFPEVNDDDRGWIARLPTENREIRWTTPEEKRNSSVLLEKELFRIFRAILENPEQISEKSPRAVEYIRRHHGPDVFRRRMEERYFRAIRGD